MIVKALASRVIQMRVLIKQRHHVGHICVAFWEIMDVMRSLILGCSNATTRHLA